jgi:hypothetical protein
MYNASKQHTGVVLRAAAVLTTSAVASAVFNVNATTDGSVEVFIDFTLGSLTNGIFNPQISPDGTNWYDVTSPGALTLTASGSKAFLVPAKGAKQFRVQVTGTGTVTGSSAKVAIGYQDLGGVLG